MPGAQPANSAFAPHAYLHNNPLHGAAFGSTSPGRPAIFNEAGFARIDSTVTEDPVRDSFNSSTGSQGAVAGSGGQDVEKMFNAFTNQVDDDEVPPSSAPGTGKDAAATDTADVKNEKTTDSKWDGDDDMELFFDGP